MELEIIGFDYVRSSTHKIAVAPYHCPPRRAIARSDNSYSMPIDPMINVFLRDTLSGKTYEYNAYKFFSRMLHRANLRMSQARAAKIIEYYKSISPFHVEYWDVWPEIPDIRLIIG